MRNILFILAALLGFGAFGQTNVPTIQMLATTNGVVKTPKNITSIIIGGWTFTNLAGFGLVVSNGQLSVDTTQLPEGSGGSSLVTSVGDDFEVTGGQLGITNTVGTGPLVRQSEAGSGGGTNFIDAVSADFEVLTQSLSLTNTTGTGAILRASTLSPYLLSATAASTYATLESPSFTGTVSFEIIQADAVQVPFASLYASANSSSNLTGTLDGGSWMNLNGSSIASGTVAAARLDGAMATDAEVAATFAPLASPPLTGTPLVNSTNLMAHIADHLTEAEASAKYQGTNATLSTVSNLTGGTTSNYLRGDGTFAQVSTNDIPGLVAALAAGVGGGLSDGGTAASLTITNLTTSDINSQPYYNTANGDAWSDGMHWTGSASMFNWPWQGSAINSGSIGAHSGATNSPGIATLDAAAGASSGWCFASGTTSIDISGRGPEFTSIHAIPATNNVIWRSGFFDTVTASDPADAAYIRMQNGFVYGVIANASSATYTTTSNQIAPSSTSQIRWVTRCNPDGSGATFWMLTATGPGTYATNWTESVSATLPTGSGRLTGHGVLAYDTAGSAGKDLLLLDAMGIRFTEILVR